MASELNKPIVKKCRECTKELSIEEDSHGLCEDTLDHSGLCCGCYDIGFGRKPSLKLNSPSVANWFDNEDYDDDN
jgi:hypothetical protein